MELQAQENTYDLEANLSVLRLYQFGPNLYRSNIVNLILMKALTNLPHTDFVLCKCLLTQDHVSFKPLPNLHYLDLQQFRIVYFFVAYIMKSLGFYWF